MPLVCRIMTIVTNDSCFFRARICRKDLQKIIRITPIFYNIIILYNIELKEALTPEGFMGKMTLSFVIIVMLRFGGMKKSRIFATRFKSCGI